MIVVLLTPDVGLRVELMLVKALSLVSSMVTSDGSNNHCPVAPFLADVLICACCKLSLKPDVST